MVVRPFEILIVEVVEGDATFLMPQIQSRIPRILSRRILTLNSLLPAWEILVVHLKYRPFHPSADGHLLISQEGRLRRLEAIMVAMGVVAIMGSHSRTMVLIKEATINVVQTVEVYPTPDNMGRSTMALNTGLAKKATGDPALINMVSTER